MRELKNVLERAIVFYGTPELESHQIELDPYIEPNPAPALHTQTPMTINGAQSRPNHSLQHPMILPEKGINLEDLERDLLLQAMEQTHNNQTKAADLLGISRHTFRYRLEKHGIIKP
jgi:DNA-binding NtrC family response regulator